MNAAIASDPALMQAAADLECGLHDLAQPLTALAFLTQASLMQSDAATWREALQAAETETLRAMRTLRTVREAVEQLTGVGGAQ